MTDGRAVSIDGLERAVAIARRINRRIGSWLAWEKNPPADAAEKPAYETMIRADLLLLTATVDDAVTECATCRGARRLWDCPQWPGCDCPGGAPMAHCPGRTKPCPDCAGR